MNENFKKRMTAFWRGVKSLFDMGDVIFLAAVGAVGYGVAQIYQPLAWIVVGLILLVTLWRPTRGEK